MLLPYTPDIDYVELKNSDGKRVGAFHNYPVNMSYFVSMTTDTDEYEGVKCYKIIIYTSDERWTDWKFIYLPKPDAIKVAKCVTLLLWV
jgi:hypothetical protein